MKFPCVPYQDKNNEEPTIFRKDPTYLKVQVNLLNMGLLTQSTPENEIMKNNRNYCLELKFYLVI